MDKQSIQIAKRRLEYMAELDLLIDRKKELDRIDRQIEGLKLRLSAAEETPVLFLEQEIEHDRMLRHIDGYFLISRDKQLMVING